MNNQQRITPVHPTLVRLDWIDHAACRGMDRRLFFPDAQTHWPGQPAQQICLSCPVRNRCLDHALSFPEHHGIWGGTTPFQRRNLLRSRVRVHCPGCGSGEIDRGSTEICLACGLSWETARIPASGVKLAVAA